MRSLWMFSRSCNTMKYRDFKCLGALRRLNGIVAFISNLNGVRMLKAMTLHFKLMLLLARRFTLT